MHIPNHGPPQSRLWPAKNPGAASRLAAVRAALLTIAERYELPVENLITPEHLRRLAWRPPTPATEDSVEQALADLGARPWQRELTVAAITPLLAASSGRTQPTS
jgi:ribonuclease D